MRLRMGVGGDPRPIRLIGRPVDEALVCSGMSTDHSERGSLRVCLFAPPGRIERDLVIGFSVGIGAPRKPGLSAHNKSRCSSGRSTGSVYHIICIGKIRLSVRSQSQTRRTEPSSMRSTNTWLSSMGVSPSATADFADCRRCRFDTLLAAGWKLEIERPGLLYLNEPSPIMHVQGWLNTALILTCTKWRDARGEPYPHARPILPRRSVGRDSKQLGQGDHASPTADAALAAEVSPECNRFGGNCGGRYEGRFPKREMSDSWKGNRLGG
jgi:hypothetical protein